MTSSTHIRAHGFYGIAVGEMLEHAGHFVFLASGTHARGPCIQIAEDRVIGVLLAPSNSSRPRKAWRRTGPALLQAQFTLGQLSIGHGLQTGLHKSRANLVLADHMHNGKTASRPLNLLAQSN